MSYLSSDVGLPNFTKAVISLWFRVPQASVKVAKQRAAGPPDPVTMIGGGVIPLLVFGELTKGFRGSTSSDDPPKEVTTRHTGFWAGGAFTEDPRCPPATSLDGYRDKITGFADPFNLAPSFIGLDCSGAAPVIAVNLQTQTYAHRTGLFYDQAAGTSSGDTYAIENDDRHIISTSSPPPSGMRTQSWVTLGDDKTDFVLCGSPERFTGVSNILISSDVWHHLLLSFDLGGSIGDAKSTCRMWMALDDINYTGASLPADALDPTSPNSIFTPGGFAPDQPAPPHPETISGWGFSYGHLPPPYDSIQVNFAEWVDFVFTGKPASITYRLAPSSLKAAPLGAPATREFSSSILQIQMAELQIFTGVTLDTSVKKNRRAFINSKGQPVDEAYGVAKYRGIYGPKTPNVTPSAPIKLLGRRPDVAIVRSAKNWMSGFDFNKTSFRPHGKIRPVKPDPVLGK